MVGYNHATMAASAGILTLPIAHLANPVEQIAYVTACAGMGLLPDWDQNGSHVSRMWGPPSRVVADAINLLDRGHRWGSHDLLLAPLTFGALFALAARSPLTQTIAFAVAFGLALRGLTAMGATRVGALANLTLSWGASWLLIHHGHGHVATWLPLACVVGVVTHGLGDLPTNEGLPVPIIWLWTRARFTLNLFSTNGPLERVVIAPALTLLAVWLAKNATGITSLDQLGEGSVHLVSDLVWPR